MCIVHLFLVIDIDEKNSDFDHDHCFKREMICRESIGSLFEVMNPSESKLAYHIMNVLSNI